METQLDGHAVELTGRYISSLWPAIYGGQNSAFI